MKGAALISGMFLVILGSLSCVPEEEVVKTSRTPTPHLVREYPQREADGSVVLVQQWSDGRYTKTSAEQGAALPATATPRKEEPELGKSRTNPIPLGDSLKYGDIEVTVLRVASRSLIGEKGQWKIPGMDYWEAPSGKRYVVVTIRLVNGGSPDKTKLYNTIDFRVVGSKGRIYEWPVLEPNLGNNLSSGEFFGGSSVSGDVIREVDADDSALVLIWSAGLGVSRYFALE